MFLAASGAAHSHVMLQGSSGSEVNILFEAGQVRHVRSETGRWSGVRIEALRPCLPIRFSWRFRSDLISSGYPKALVLHMK